jgi:hypothetical protein
MKLAAELATVAAIKTEMARRISFPPLSSASLSGRFGHR